MSTSQLTTKGTVISTSGILDASVAEAIADSLTDGHVWTLDFSEVTEIKFAALRTLLNCRKSGKRFCVINAEDSVAERFEDTGVSVFINICRKPKPLLMGRYDEFGASFLSKAYNSGDGDSMLKVYGANVPKWMVAQEKAIARAVMIFGIPTPLVGTLYEDGEKTGLDFEKIEGKRSFSRIIYEDPSRLEEISIRFARMCKQLHSTPCDTNIFSDRSIYYRQAVMNCKELTDGEKSKAIAFIDSVPEATTCLHGDMQISNVITNGKEDLWIDLADFGYGNPMFDMGMWYFQCILNDEKIMLSIFRLNKEQMGRVFDIFIEEYFGADTAGKKEDVRARILPYAALHMIYLGSTYGFIPGMVEAIRQILFR